MEMFFLPFPRGRTARGTPNGQMVLASQFLNRKAQPILNVLRNETELAQILIGTEFINRGLCRCLKARNPGCVCSRSIGKNLELCKSAGFLEPADIQCLASVRDIRNTISHADFAVTLSDREVDGHIKMLRAWLKAQQSKWTAETVDGATLPGWTGELVKIGECDANVPKTVFLGAVIMLYVGLANLQWAIDPSTYTGEAVLSFSRQDLSILGEQPSQP